MNIAISNGSVVKGALYAGDVDFDTDVFKAALIRENFTFNSTLHKYMKNLNKVTTTSNMYATASTKMLESYSGSFVTDGLVAGNYITIAGATNTNLGTYRVTTVADTTLKVAVVDSSTWADCGASDDEQSLTVTSRDEARAIDFVAGNDGEITVSVTSTGFVTTDRWDTVHKFRTGEVFHTGGSANNGTGDNLGPFIVTSFSANGLTMYVSPIGGGAALVVDASAQAYTFTNGTAWNLKYAPVTVTFTLDGNTLTLDPFNFSDFGVARWGSPGFVIYDDTHASDLVVAYCRFSDWTLSF
jgi:hypothetical protein